MGKATNEFFCEVCNDGVAMSGHEANEHLKNVHHLENARGTKQMTMHIDGRDWYESRYTWTFGKLVLLQVCHNPRTKKTQMY